MSEQLKRVCELVDDMSDIVYEELMCYVRRGNRATWSTGLEWAEYVEAFGDFLVSNGLYDLELLPSANVRLWLDALRYMSLID